MVGVFDILYLPLWNPIDIFYYVMNLWRIRPDFIPLALLASDFYLSLASGGQKKLVTQWRKRFMD